jgi:hypothetical protein
MPDKAFDAAGLEPHIPNGIERLLKLDEDGAGADEKGDKAEDGRKEAGFGLIGSGEDGLNGRRAIVAHQSIDLSEQFAMRRFRSEDGAGQRQHQDKQRRDGEDGIKSDGCAHGRSIGAVPNVNGLHNVLIKGFKFFRDHKFSMPWPCQIIAEGQREEDEKPEKASGGKTRIAPRMICAIKYPASFGGFS